MADLLVLPLLMMEVLMADLLVLPLLMVEVLMAVPMPLLQLAVNNSTFS
jgi:hypothetical protein